MRLDDSLHAGAGDVAGRLTGLLDLAEAEGMFGVDGHDIRPWHGGAPTGTSSPSNRPAARSLSTDRSVMSICSVATLTAPAAPINALTRLARVTNSVLAVHHAQLRAVHGATDAPRPTTASAHRAFANSLIHVRGDATAPPPNPGTSIAEPRPTTHR